jgi:hypothetical protein
MTNFLSLFKQAQEMQGQMAELQAELGKKTVEVATGGGMVKVVVNGLSEVLSIRIDEELINMKDKEVLEDLIVGAVNEAHRQVKGLAQEAMSQAGGLFKIPGMFTGK